MSDAEPKQSVWELRLLFKIQDLSVLTSLMTLARAWGAEVENLTQKDKE